MITILFQSAWAVAIDKPPGLPTTAPKEYPSAESVLRQQLGGDDYLTAVHRLDRDVGGVLLMARSKKAARLLSEQFAVRRVQKTYHAWVRGHVTDVPATWTDHVRKISGVPRGEVCQSDCVDAKLAITEIRVIGSNDARKSTLLELSPSTGRMHQLRLQTSHRGYPICNDPLYDPHCQPDGPSISLLAKRLEFNDPVTAKRMIVESVLEMDVR